MFSYFSVDDESLSNYLEHNLMTYGQRKYKGQQLIDITKDEDFAESNLMHNINGYMYGNNMDIVCQGQALRWCVLPPGTLRGLHIRTASGHTLFCDTSICLFFPPSSSECCDV